MKYMLKKMPCSNTHPASLAPAPQRCECLRCFQHGQMQATDAELLNRLRGAKPRWSYLPQQHEQPEQRPRLPQGHEREQVPARDSSFVSSPSPQNTDTGTGHPALPQLQPVPQHGGMLGTPQGRHRQPTSAAGEHIATDIHFTLDLADTARAHSSWRLRPCSFSASSSMVCIQPNAVALRTLTRMASYLHRGAGDPHMRSFSASSSMVWIQPWSRSMRRSECRWRSMPATMPGTPVAALPSLVVHYTAKLSTQKQGVARAACCCRRMLQMHQVSFPAWFAPARLSSKLPRAHLRWFPGTGCDAAIASRPCCGRTCIQGGSGSCRRAVQRRAQRAACPRRELCCTQAGLSAGCERSDRQTGAASR
jgi:hypothetical protein